MKSLVKSRGLEGSIFCDSAGTSAHHEGEPADFRMSQFASERGYSLESLSRPFRQSDFEDFDFILTMDNSNFSNVMALDVVGQYQHKVFPFTKFCKVHNVNAVPDPYYDGDEGFRLVMDIVEDGCQGLLDHLEEKVLRNG